MLELINKTWKQIEKIDKSKSILFVTMAPIEEHSLHLPLGTDVYEGEHWIKETIKLIEFENPAIICCKLPAFPIASAGIKGLYGCIYFKPKTTYQITLELLDSIVHWDFKNIIVVASHGDPIHQIAVEKACKKINKKYGTCAISPMGAFFSAKELGINLNLPSEIMNIENKAENDFHAGWIETSCMLDIERKLVSDCYKSLPENKIAEKDMISAKKQRKAMEEYGHLGYPALADENIGKLLNINTAQYLAMVSIKFLDRKDYTRYMFHSLYKLPFMHLRFL